MAFTRHFGNARVCTQDGAMRDGRRGVRGFPAQESSAGGQGFRPPFADHRASSCRSLALTALDPPAKPRLGLLTLEPLRAAVEFARMRCANAPKGDGHAVVLFPGLGADHKYMVPLAKHCERLGCTASLAKRAVASHAPPALDRIAGPPYAGASPSRVAP
jgi:hypothetical protein